MKSAMISMMMAAGGNRGGGSAVEKALAEELNKDISTSGDDGNGAGLFHKHIAKALLDNVKEDDVAQAIRDNWEILRPKAIAAGMPEDTTVDQYVEHEFEMAAFQNALAELFGDDDSASDRD